jgi:hypothetical protein
MAESGEILFSVFRFILLPTSDCVLLHFRNRHKCEVFLRPSSFISPGWGKRKRYVAFWNNALIKFPSTNSESDSTGLKQALRGWFLLRLRVQLNTSEASILHFYLMGANRGRSHWNNHFGLRMFEEGSSEKIAIYLVWWRKKEFHDLASATGIARVMNPEGWEGDAGSKLEEGGNIV